MGMFQKIKAYLNEDDAEYDALIEEQERLREERRKRRNQSRAERNKEKAKRAAEKAVLKERVDPELRKEVRETVSSNRERKTVGDFCEQLVDTKYHMDDMKQEYKLVTDYLVDIQRIEELPVNLAEDIVDTARQIEKLDGNRNKYQQSENLLTTEQYHTMQRLEADIPDTIRNLNDMEMRDSMLKNDMGYLEGEKEDLKYARVEDTDNAYRIRGALIVVLVLFLLISITLFAVALLAKKDVTLPAAIEGTVAVICFVVCYIQYANISRRVRETDAKLQRAVSLLNKVKAKYVNNTNTLDYIYEKYGVNSGKELMYRWDLYNQMQRDAKKYSQASESYYLACDRLVKQLADVGIADPMVWKNQTNALIDRREMVEIKHGLNVRRQKIREKMASCEKIRQNATSALKASIAANPGIESYIRELLATYDLEL